MLTSFSKSFFFYLLLMAGGVWAFYSIKHYGNQLYPSAIDVGSANNHEKINHLLHVLMALGVVIIIARIFGFIFKLLDQPSVIGEVVGGIMLGPSVLGRFAPDVSHAILPSDSAPFLSIIAQLGIILYMFIIGLELDLKVIKRSGPTAMFVSVFSVVFSFIAGCALSLYLFKNLAGPAVRFTGFSMFIGVAISVTAFPVLARILAENGLQKTSIGTLALTSAAIEDVMAWCLLALVVSVLKANPQEALWTLFFTVVYILAMLFIARPLIFKSMSWFEQMTKITESSLALVFIAILASSLLTESIGIHAIFGSFLLGAITPHDSKITHQMTEKLEDLVRILFLPAFFAFTGMRTQVGLLDSINDWMICLLIIGVASFAKFGSVFVSARMSKISWRESTALGILLNTRGMVELIVLNIGLDLGVLSPRLFTMMVIMALVTTFITGPLLNVTLKLNKKIV